MISFAATSKSPFVAYTLELVETMTGLSLIAVDDGRDADAADVYYGNDPQRPCLLRIPSVSGYTIDNVPTQASLTRPTGPEMPFPFDLFSAIRFWLADEGNSSLPRLAFDTHDRLLAKHSSQERRGVREVPIVNAYVWLLTEWIKSRTSTRPRACMPPGRQCMVALSHDVDDPVDPGDWAYGIRLIGLAARHGRLRLSLSYSFNLGRRFRARWTRPNDRHWLFREVLTAEARHGFLSTFFFASQPRFANGATRFDVDYDVRSPRFQRVFRDIVDRGAEIGLHTSYDARNDADRIAAERETLERASGVQIKGNRHHYWHMRRPFWPTLEDHGRAGLIYDTSIAFNEAPGFRLGVGFPFHPWNPLTQRAVSTLAIPTFLMDGGFFYDQNVDVESALRWFTSLLDELKRHRAVAAIDWHVRTSFPGSQQYKRWGETYLAMLEILAADSEVHVGSCLEAYELCQPRDRHA